MGRRKLTRILHEVCGTNGLQIRNAQGEGPRDIAMRKSLKPIIEILNAPTPTPIPPTPTNAKCASNDLTDGRQCLKQSQHRSDSGSGQNYTSDTSEKFKYTQHQCVNNRRLHDPNSSDDSKIWSPFHSSPYGCNYYFPDPRTFPPPKLDSFPQDPLKTGEQYYCDLAGNIRKGPVGKGNTCYCGPFFNHIEQKINQNKKCFKKYVFKASGKHDAKAAHDDKIHRIARYASLFNCISIESKFIVCFLFFVFHVMSFHYHRSIMADHRDKHGYDYWPKRSDPLRATVVPQLSKTNKDELNNNTLSRCRSLEYLDERKSMDGKQYADHMRNRGNLHRSFDLLANTEKHEAIVHHHQHHGQSDAMSSKYNSIHQPSTNTSESGHRSLSSKHKKYALDFREKYGNATTTHSTRSDVESLEDFSNQSMEIIQMKRAARQRFKERTMYELHKRQKAADNSFLKYPPNFNSTQTAASIDDLRDYHSSNHYPTDFDNISVEMKNITKLLSASMLEPLESAPSTSSSFYHSTDKLARRFTLYDKDNVADDIDGDDISEFERDATNSCISVKDSVIAASGTTLTTNGFFQNKSFSQNQSSSSCDTLKSIELPKTNGNENGNGKLNNTNGHNDEDTIGDDDEEEDDDDDNQDDDDDDDNESSESEESVAKVPDTLTAAQRISSQHVPRTGLVSARIKSLLAKNLQTSNKMPSVRSSLVTNSSNLSTFKSSKHSRTPLKSCNPMKTPLNSNNKSEIHAVTHTVSTNNAVHMLEADKTGDSSENEAEITVHKATVHTNQIQNVSNDERTNNES